MVSSTVNTWAVFRFALGYPDERHLERFAELCETVPETLAELRALYIDLFEAGLPQPRCPLLESAWLLNRPAGDVVLENKLYYQNFRAGDRWPGGARSSAHPTGIPGLAGSLRSSRQRGRGVRATRAHRFLETTSSPIGSAAWPTCRRIPAEAATRNSWRHWRGKWKLLWLEDGTREHGMGCFGMRRSRRSSRRLFSRQLSPSPISTAPTSFPWTTRLSSTTRLR